MRERAYSDGMCVGVAGGEGWYGLPAILAPEPSWFLFRFISQDNGANGLRRGELAAKSETFLGQLEVCFCFS